MERQFARHTAAQEAAAAAEWEDADRNDKSSSSSFAAAANAVRRNIRQLAGYDYSNASNAGKRLSPSSASQFKDSQIGLL